MLKFAPHSRLLFIGDSVTDVGRTQPVAEGLFDPLGKGYPNIVNGLLWAFYPERHIHVINTGTSGNTVRDLKNRWQTDVIDLKPDWLSINIGINDVWRQFDCPEMKSCQVQLEEYAATLEELIVRTLPLLSGGLILMTPHYLEPNRQDAMRARMDQYGDVCRELARKHKLILVDTQKAFDEMLKHCHSSFISWDRVHPNVPGHHVMARAFLEAAGFEW